MVIVGYAADAAMWVLNRIHPLTGETLTIKLIVFIPTMALFLVAVAFYMVVELGVTPYDAIPQIIHGRQKRYSFTAVRVTWDVAMILSGVVAGGSIGPMTLVCGFCLGPVISAIAQRFRIFFDN